MKKFFIALMSLSLLCTLTACGSNQASESKPHKTSSSKIVKHHKKHLHSTSSVASSYSSIASESTTEQSNADSTSETDSSQAPTDTNDDSNSSNGAASDSVSTDDQGFVHHIHMTGQQFQGSNLGTDTVTSPDGTSSWRYEYVTPAN